MEDRNKIILLYDYYKELLNDTQKRYFEDYYFNNLSLGEIADEYSVSRNAIHKQIKNVVDKLYFYEEKLNMLDKNQRIIDLIEDEKLKNEILKIIEG